MDAIDKASPRQVGAKAAILRRKLSLLARQPGAAYSLGPRLARFKARISAVRAKVKKSGDDPVDVLYGEIEKAKGRGLVPKGGSLKLLDRLPAGGARRKRLATYILRRTANIEGRVKRK